MASDHSTSIDNEINVSQEPGDVPTLSPAETANTAKYPATLESITFPAPPALPKIIVTKEDIKNNIEVYESLLAASGKLRKALAAVAEAENEFGTALEASAKCKGASVAEDGLSGSAGLHYLAANHHRILSESFTKGFELPVRASVDTYAKLTKEHEEKFQKETIAKTKELRKTEKQNVKLGKKKQRNLALYRNALIDLTNQVDGLERLKYEYFKYSLDITQDISTKILKHATGIVRAEVEIFEGIAKKGWTGEGLDEVLADSTDPFAVEEVEENHDIYTILPSGSIIPQNDQEESKTVAESETFPVEEETPVDVNSPPVVVEAEDGEVEQPGHHQGEDRDKSEPQSSGFSNDWQGH
ncbi:hypothetical protein V1514DRAFT_324065 [Lipomyces japonicus]|uniref:uncharacterized protein n=1 Tax=Lipomyces japonicus TaxID=56871 RepID=UPI0034CECFD1